MRVGLVIGQLTIGGAERQLWEVARGLAPRFVPIVYCLADTPGPLAAELSRLGIVVRTIGHRGVTRARKLAGQLRADGIQVVHTWLFIANAYALAARWCGARQPLITSARNCKVQGQVNRALNILAFRASQSIVVNSGDVAAYIERWYHAPTARIRVIPNGIDTEHFRPSPLAGASPASRPILTVGRLVKQKNHALFLAAAARVVQAVPQARFLIVGDGPLRPALEAQARQLGLGARVTFAGERTDVDDLLRGAALFWLTSLWEGMPNVVLEALASAVPVIATDVGGTRELVRSGVDGFVVPSGDAGALALHSQTLLRDPHTWDRFSRSARARAEEFSTSRMVQTMSQLYEEVAACRR